MQSYVVHCLQRRSFQPIFTEFSPSSPGHGGQDGPLFPCSVPVMLQYRGDLYTPPRRYHHSHDAFSYPLERYGGLSIQR